MCHYFMVKKGPFEWNFHIYMLNLGSDFGDISKYKYNDFYMRVTRYGCGHTRQQGKP